MTLPIDQTHSLLEELSSLNPPDIAHSKLTRQQLLAVLSESITEKNKLEGVLQSIDNGVFAVDWDGKLILFNQAAEVITGLKKEEVIGQYCEGILQIIDDKGAMQSADSPLATAFAKDKEIKIPLCYLKSSKHRKIPASITYSPIKGLKNALVLGICVFRDLRKEKELEQMKADFVSMAAHELRTPLTSIRGYLSVLDEELTDVSAEYREFIRRALVSTNRLDTLIKNILSVAKIERGKIVINFHEFSPLEVVQSVIALCSDHAREKKIELKMETVDVPSIVIGDREKILEVLTNFVDNAISYTPEKGTISAVVTGKKNMVEFRVTDTGVGLTRNDIGKLFKKFSRASSTSSEVKGTGLGLYISKLIIGMHKGSIGVQSAGSGKGSSFYFVIPVKPFTTKNHRGRP